MGPRRWPGLTPERKKQLLVITAGVLNTSVHPCLRSLKTAAERREDRWTRGGKRPQRMPPQRMRGRPPKLMLGRQLQERRTDPLLERDCEEANGQEPRALPRRLLHHPRTFCGPVTISTKVEAVCLWMQRSIGRHWSDSLKMVIPISDGVTTGGRR